MIYDMMEKKIRFNIINHRYTLLAKINKVFPWINVVV